MIELEIPNPYTKQEILESIPDLARKIEAYYRGLGHEIFFHDGLGGWSPAQNLAHITWIQNMAVLLLKAPRFLLLPFGKRPSQRDFQTLQRDYLSSGKPIPLGPLAPAKLSPPKEATVMIESMLLDWNKSARDIYFALQAIPESEFDEYSLPHPSMGMLSLREIFYLLLIHPVHHTLKVEQKINRVSR